MTEKKFYVTYAGSKFWPIFWAIIYFPVALVLFFSRSTFNINATSYSLKYNGSSFWLGFWTIVLFPIALILLLLNGVAAVSRE